MQKAVLTFFCLLIPTLASALENLQEIYQLYRQGSYQKVVEQLEQKSEKDPLRNYMMGITFNKLQKYDLAIPCLEKAINQNIKAQDVHYELGQALYAYDEFKKARSHFEESYKKGFKKEQSLFYVAYLSELLGELKIAKDHYENLLKLKFNDKNLRQTTNYRLTLVLVKLLENKRNVRTMVQKYILPRIKETLNIDPDSTLVPQIRRFYEIVERRYALGEYQLANGRIIPQKRYSLYFSQSAIYDSNVTLASDQIAKQASGNDSYYFNSELFASYRIISKQRYIFTPEIRLTNLYYSNRHAPQVYQNDTYSLGTALRSRIEHRLWNKKAAWLFDMAYNYTARDRLQQHRRIFYGQSKTLTVGEQLQLFKSSDTTFKLRHSNYKSYDGTLSSKTASLVIDQTTMLPNKDMLFALLSLDLVRTQEESMSTDSLLFQLDYLFPSLGNGYILSLGHALTLLDTKQQWQTRGLEVTLHPNIRLSKNLSPNLRINIRLDYNRVFSRDKEYYDYSKYETGFEVKYRF